MEDSIWSLCNTLASFCNHLQSSCDALKQSVERRPIPLDSASSTFVQCLNRRVSSASSELNLLESMSFGTVSFEELLGHCNEVYKKNQSNLAEVEDRLMNFGYVPETDVDEDYDVSGLSTPLGLDSKFPNSKEELDPPSSCHGPVSAPRSVMKILEEDSLFDESLSLQNLGLSDVCLATLASEANGKIDNLDTSIPTFRHYEDKQNAIMGTYQPVAEILGMTEGDNLKSAGVPKSVINVAKDNYESLPSYLKTLASWEDLLDTVSKMNSKLSQKDDTTGCNFFRQDELESLGLGPKGRSYLLLLVRMNKVVVETVDGVISYRVL